MFKPWAAVAAMTLVTQPASNVLAESPDLARLPYDIMKVAHSSPQLSESALSEKLLQMLIGGTQKSFQYADRDSEEKITHISVDCAIWSGPSRVIFMDAILRLSLIEVVAASRNRNIKYVAKSMPWGVVVDSISPPTNFDPKPLVIRVLTAKGDQILNSIVNEQGMRSLCNGRYGPIWLSGRAK